MYLHGKGTIPYPNHSSRTVLLVLLLLLLLLWLMVLLDKDMLQYVVIVWGQTCSVIS